MKHGLVTVVVITILKDTRGVNLGGQGGGHVPPEFGGGGRQCIMSPQILTFSLYFRRNSLKLGQNYAYRNPKLLQLLGDFVPQTSYRSFTPGPQWGLLSPQTPTQDVPHIFYQVYAAEGQHNSSTTIYSFPILCLEHHYCGDQQWRSLT